ncbi:MAG: radical SAM protein [Myxococcota bacterium]
MTLPAPEVLFPRADPDGARAFKLDLKLGFRCNNKCQFCVQGDKRDHVRDLTTAEAIERLQQARATCDGVLLTGGEITIREDVPEIIRAAKSLGYQLIQVQTNGRRLAYPKYCEALVEAGATEFNPSLHGHTPELHDQLVGAAGAFRQCVQGMRNLQRLKQKVLSQTVITRSNVAYLLPTARLLVSLGVHQVQFAFVHALGSAEKNWDETVPRYPDVAKALGPALDFVRTAGRQTITEAVPFCFLHGREWAAIEPALPDTTVLDGDVTIGDYERYRREEGKRHGPPCQSCTWQLRCEGPWKEYPQKYGWDEFVPRMDVLPDARR